MFDSPGAITATAATEKGTPQAAPRSTFVPENRNTRTSPRAFAASSGQFEARTTSFAAFDFVARRTSRNPNRTSPVSVATRRARDMSITAQPPPAVPPAPAVRAAGPSGAESGPRVSRSEEHTSELQSQFHLVCRLLL